MTGYTRQSTYSDGDSILAADSNNEFDAIEITMAAGTGHKHDNTAAEGAFVPLISNSANTKKVETTASGAKTTGDHQVTGQIISDAGPITATLGNIVATAGDVVVTAGNVVMTAGGATVDGRDLTVDGTKLDGIETAATADQTAADIRGLGFFDITNDGSASGLDADLIDGLDSTLLARLDIPNSGLTGKQTITQSGGNYIDMVATGATSAPSMRFMQNATEIATIDSLENGSVSELVVDVDPANTLTGSTFKVKTDGGTTRLTVDSTALAVLGNITATGTIDATTLDGVDSTSFLRSDAADTKTSGDLKFNDNIASVYGTGSDFKVFHDGSTNHITGLTNTPLTLTSQVANINLKVNNTENAIVCNVNGGVDLYHNNVKKLETESVGATLTGNLTVTGTVDGRDVAADGATLDALQGISAAWPVGSIYMNASNGTNPATLLGFGTWVAFGTGRVLVAIDTGQAEFNVLGETGGAKTHTLTTAELAAHTHGVLASDFPGGAGRLEVAGGSPESTQTSQSAGSGNAHNNLQPYITVHMFKRTA